MSSLLLYVTSTLGNFSLDGENSVIFLDQKIVMVELFTFTVLHKLKGWIISIVLFGVDMIMGTLIKVSPRTKAIFWI